MTLEQYEILAYHFLFVTFFIPSIWDTIKFTPNPRDTIVDPRDQYLNYLGNRIWNSHFGDLFTGIFLAAFWPIFSLVVLGYLSLKIYNLIPKRKSKTKVK